MRFDRFDTPIGEMTVAADDAGLRHVLFPDNKYPPAGRDGWRRDTDALRAPREQLLAYFAGELAAFDLALAPTGTPFQVKVWTMLAGIPYGQTWSYGELARRIGEPKAVRAVGAANGRNPLPVILPCHRVIGADGSLTGFGGGLPLKKFLLGHEGAGQRGLGF
ncbi:methylated-DNA--[protein]-cysteine S-methyltransferase [Arenimonas terrae]|uniref:Methylated-DNA--protein-cysteine methyltransferase n=1 Tax=Arenimonas terrae TaxID=2546226 RepID=A0A5C4RWX3_9GAMM|nr:methylated-DNA--[protein]-cysteine S-methyltransferase [Arenimonas terrae]TNJ35251.1 methylated-DNA--[protein]-cysteine S-methyltransferase [Arenimonas terrae]